MTEQFTNKGSPIGCSNCGTTSTAYKWYKNEACCPACNHNSWSVCHQYPVEYRKQMLLEEMT